MIRILGSLHPALYMMMVVVSFSATPVMFKLGNAEESPFLFTGILQSSIGLGLGAAILHINRKLLFNPDVIESIKSHCKTGLMLVSVIGHFGFALFALGLTFVDVSIAAILLETRPLFLILIIAFLFKGTQRYRNISAGTMIFMFLSIAGVALVILSQNDTPQPLPVIGADFADFTTLIGVLLVLMAAIGGAAAPACTLKLGKSLADKHSHTENRNVREIVFALFITCIGLFISGCILCAIGLIVSEPISWHQLFYAITGGLLVNSIGIAAFRVANLKTDDLGLNALAYITPLVTLIWLWLLSILDVPHPDYLIIGAMAIVASNLLINAKADMRVAYSALVISLWVFGTFVYFHDGYTTEVPLELTVTVFILVLSFRVDRLARRTSREEEWVFEAFRRLELLVVKRQISDDAWREPMLKIDKHEKLHELTAAYADLTRYLAAQMKKGKAPRDALDEIMGIRHLVDNLVHSRQQGAHFGEIVAIALTGALIVTGLLLFSGHREVYGEITSFVLSAVVVFLFFNILDLQKDRRGRILKYGGKEYDGEYVVKFDDKARSRKVQQWISVMTSAVIVLVFAWLFTWERAPF